MCVLIEEHMFGLFCVCESFACVASLFLIVGFVFDCFAACAFFGSYSGWFSIIV